MSMSFPNYTSYLPTPLSLSSSLLQSHTLNMLSHQSNSLPQSSTPLPDSTVQTPEDEVQTSISPLTYTSPPPLTQARQSTTNTYMGRKHHHYSVDCRYLYITLRNRS